MDSSTSTIILSGDVPRSTLSQMLTRGAVRRLATGVYTTDTSSAPERVVRREWRTIAGRLFPDATISDRSAQTAGSGGRNAVSWSTRTTTARLSCPDSRCPCAAALPPSQATSPCPAACTRLRSPGPSPRTPSPPGLAAVRSRVGSPATNSVNGSSALRDLAVPTSSVRCATKCAHWHHYSGSAPRTRRTLTT